MLKPSEKEKEQYALDGYFLRTNFFSSTEIDEFRSRARDDLEKDLRKDKVMIKADKLSLIHI